MATIERFEELKVWRRARTLCKEVYACTSARSFARDYSLKDQIRRASTSILLNIAEGFARQSNKEFKQFLYISHGSSAEVQACLYIAKDQEYIDDETFSRLYQHTDEISKMIAGFIKYLTTKL